MKIVALEEHFVPEELFDAWKALPPDRRDLSYDQSATGGIRERLLDMFDERIRDINRAGVDMQVLSLTTAGAQSLSDEDRISRHVNDLAAEVVRKRPDRFQAFATLPMGDPEKAVTELRRAVVDLGLNGAMVYGRVGDRNLDDPAFRPVLEEAARLRAPLYVHPQTPRQGVRDIYYSGIGDTVDPQFATGGIGWHYETGMQITRLVLQGVFDELPDLRIVVGHWGEVVLFYLDRIDDLTGPAGLTRPVSDYWRSNVWVTPSGIFSARYLRWAVEVLGIDRVMFATDYPYKIGDPGEARRFVEEADLSPEAREKFGFRNWEKLVGEIRRERPA